MNDKQIKACAYYLKRIRNPEKSRYAYDYYQYYINRFVYHNDAHEPAEASYMLSSMGMQSIRIALGLILAENE